MVKTPLTFVLAMPIGPSPSEYPLLEQALRSVRAQATPLKLAVLDASGSADVSATLDANADLISHRRTGPDAGQAAAIQEGWDALSGDVYGWLNADDFLFPGALETVANRFADAPSADAVTGQSLFFDLDPETRRYTVRGLHPEVRPPDRTLLKTNTISQPSTFVKRAALESVGWLDTALAYTMDWDLWVRLFVAGHKFAHEREPLSAVLMCEGTKTSQFTPARRREIAALVARHSGAFVARKTLFAFWLTHQADTSGGIWQWLRTRLQQRAPIGETGDLAGHWPIAHYEDGPLRLGGAAPTERRFIEPGQSCRVAARAGGPLTLTPPSTPKGD